MRRRRGNNIRFLFLQEREDMMKAHQLELKKLHHRLDSHADSSLDHFRQAAMVRVKHETSQMFTN